MFSLKSTCNRIQVDKASINKINNKSSIQSKSMIYSSYVNKKSGNYRTVTEGQVTHINMTYATPHTATIVFRYISKPVYFEMALVNIQDATDIHMFEMYSSPYTFTGLKPNSYYTITAYATFVSTNSYSSVFPSAILTLFEGPPTDLSVNTILNKSASLHFTPSIGNPTNFTLTIIDTNNPTNVQLYQHINPPFSPFLLTGLQPNGTYDIRLSSYYSDTNNTYTVYKPAYFSTYNENNPVLNSISNITNKGATISFEYTGTPSYNVLQLTNIQDVTDIYTITDTYLYNSIIFDGLHIDSSYNLTITSVYITGHTYLKSQPNAFHTWNETEIQSAHILSIIGNAITIEFTSAVGNVLSYRVSLIDGNENTFTQSFQNVPGFVLFSNLEVFTEYTLTIVSVYIENAYLYVYSSNLQTLNEGPVTDISCSNVLNTSAYISFPASPGINMSYNITYRGERNNTQIYTMNGITNTTDISLNDLSIYTPYTVTVTTVYGLYNNSYSFSKTNLFTTLNEGASTIFDVSVIDNSIAITIMNTYDYPSSYTFHATSSSMDFSGNYIGEANKPYIHILGGLFTDISYTIYVVTEYDTNRSYTTTWPNQIRI